MKVDIDAIIDSDVLKMLIDHFNYSIKDINSYDELTDDEKMIIDKELFYKVTISHSVSELPKLNGEDIADIIKELEK
mgnify:CR=1 FL=1